MSEHDTPRDSRRVPIARRIQIKFDRFSGFIDEYVANVSPGGIFIKTQAPEVPGQELEFEFRLGDGFELIRGRGQVVWNRVADEGPNRPAGMGVRFIELSPGSKDLIYRIVDDYAARGGIPFDLGRDPSMPPPVPPPPVFGTAAPPAQAASAAHVASTAEPAASTAEPAAGTAEPAASPLAPEPLRPPPATTPEVDSSFADVAAELSREAPDSAAADVLSPAAASPENIGPPAAPDPFWPAPPRPIRMSAPDAGMLRSVEIPPSATADPLQEMAASLPPLDELAPAPGSAAASAASAAEPAGRQEGVDPAASDPPSVEAPPIFASLGAPPAEPKRSHGALWLVLALLALLAGGGFLFRDALLGLLGLGESEPPAPAAPVVANAGAGARPPGRARRLYSGPPATSALPAGSAATAPLSGGPATPAPRPVNQSPEALSPGITTPLQGAAAPPRSAVSARGQNSLPSGPGSAASGSGAPGQAVVVPNQRPAAPAPGVSAPAAGASAPPAAGPAATAVEKITWEPARGGTDVILWGNGVFRPDAFDEARLTGPVREVIRISGISQPFAVPSLRVGSAELLQIRTGFHTDRGRNQLHIVLDLAGPEVKVTGIEAAEKQLRIHVRAR